MTKPFLSSYLFFFFSLLQIIITKRTGNFNNKTKKIKTQSHFYRRVRFHLECRGAEAAIDLLTDQPRREPGDRFELFRFGRDRFDALRCLDELLR